MLPIARIFVSPTGRMPLCRGRAAIPASSRASSPTQHREFHLRSNSGRSRARIEADLAIRPRQEPGSDPRVVVATNRPASRRRQPPRKVPGGTGLVNRGTPAGRNGPRPSSVAPTTLGRKPRVSPPRAQRPRRPARSPATRWSCLMAAMLHHAPASPGVRSRCGSRPRSFESAPREAAEPITARGVRRAAGAGHVAVVVTAEITTEEDGIARWGFVWPIFFPIGPVLNSASGPGRFF